MDLDKIASDVQAHYANVPFDELRGAIVGGIRREYVESVRSSARFLLRRFEDQRCDSEGVAECVRCQAVYLAKSALEALEGVETVSELARAHVANAERA